MKKEYALLGKLNEFMEDESITEIMVNGTKNVYVEKDGKKIDSGVRFENDKEIEEIIKAVFDYHQQRIDRFIPYGDVCLEDGTRINAVIVPVAQQGPSMTIRKSTDNIKTLDDLAAKGALTVRAKDFLIACMKMALNIIFCGSTGSGKTTLLKVLMEYIPLAERMIVIEDAPEIHLPHHDNVVYLQTRLPDENDKGEVSLRDLIRNALRMRPERLILGEIRGGEALDILQAMSTGHKGTLSILHANTPEGAVARLETLVKFSGFNIPGEEIKKLIASTVNIIVHLEQLKDGSRKIAYISEIRGVERGEVLLQHIYAFKEKGTDEQGRVKGNLMPVFKQYPVFFQEMRKHKLISNDHFSEEERGWS